jgi:hypothetical protein
MRLDRLPIAMLADMATLRGETVTFGTSLTKRSSCDQSVTRDCHWERLGGQGSGRHRRQGTGTPGRRAKGAFLPDEPAYRAALQAVAKMVDR